MSNANGKDRSAKVQQEMTDEAPSTMSSRWSYHLVVIMLVLLAVLVVLTLCLPLLPLMFKDPKDASEYSKTLLEYSKWTLSVLLGAFGAWIGAGAAYFFGKENLKESSRSTEAALKLQGEALGSPPPNERIKDLVLTAMNPNFFFDFQKTKGDVLKKLSKYFRGYWFVPVVETNTGILKDVIHAQVFWSSQFDPTATLTAIVTAMDIDPDLKRLHGDLFFAKVSPNDKISEVYKLLSEKEAEVAIVVDEKGKPSHCLTNTELRTFLKVAD